MFDPVLVHVEGAIIDVNRAFEATFGYEREEALRLTVFDLVVPEDRPLLDERIRTRSDAPYQVVGTTRSGQERYLEAAGRTISYAGGPARMIALRDATERHLAEEQVGVLAFQYAADLTAVSEVARRLPRAAGAAGAREAICRAALDVCDGMLAVLMEPDGDGCLVSTAVAGAEAATMRVPIDAGESATARVFLTGEPFFVADLAGERGLSRRVVDATGAVSALWQPVLRDGEPVGVLLVAWDRALAHLSDRAAAVVGLFAAEAAVAVERADVLAQLDTLNVQLARQVEALRLSDQVKSDFVSSVSHELRTPLASILGYLEILEEGAAGDLTEPQREFLGIIDINARRLLTLIEDLLTLSGLESGRMRIRLEAVDLAELVRVGVQAQALAVAARGHTLELDVPDAPVIATVDRDRYAQVVANLLANAIKFTPDGGHVHVRLVEAGGSVALTVTDSGIGIAPEDMGRLFERFFRAHSAIEEAIPGSGLGLAISKGIAEAHGGELTAESAVDAGSAFTIRIPTSPPEGGRHA